MLLRRVGGCQASSSSSRVTASSQCGQVPPVPIRVQKTLPTPATLLRDVAGVAVRALVDAAAAAPCGGLDDDVVGMALTIAVGPLATGWVAVALASPDQPQERIRGRIVISIIGVVGEPPVR